jgi:cytochrome c biogenesis protein CcmG/thiol:disulfide interchange protein DsbE
LKRKLKTGAALAFVAALVVIFIHPSYRNGTPSLRGQTAKDFALTIDGKSTRLSDLRGKVVLLNFWASWCQPCVEEAPSLDALQKEIAPMGGTILGVSVDDDSSAYEQFLKTYNVDYPTYRDPSKQIPLSYGTTMYPETYVIDRDGRINSKIVGPQDWTSPAMMAYLDTVLRAK